MSSHSNPNNPFLSQDPNPTTVIRSTSTRKNTNPFADLGIEAPKRVIPKQDQDQPTQSQSQNVVDDFDRDVQQQLAGLDFNDNVNSHTHPQSQAQENGLESLSDAAQPQQNADASNPIPDPQSGLNPTNDFNSMPIPQPDQNHQFESVASTQPRSESLIDSQPQSSRDQYNQIPNSIPPDSNSQYPPPTQPAPSEANPNTRPIYSPPPGPPPPNNETSNLASSSASQDPNLLSDEALARQIVAEQEAERHAARQRRREREASRRNPNGARSSRARGPVEDNGDGSWAVKDIVFHGKERRIVTQNANGPCSLLALANVLLLLDQIQITPKDRPSVTYDYLSSLIANHILENCSNNDSGMDLGEALNVLPKTQKGLDVNIGFGNIDTFVGKAKDSNSRVETSSSSSSLPPELALFKLCGIDLVHGWIVDPNDSETYSALSQSSKFGLKGGDYDSSMDKLVEFNSKVKSPNEGGASSSSSSSTNPFVSSSNQTGQGLETESNLVKSFLDSTSTQLTYTGLFKLTSSLKQGELVCFFRNSHLNVLYSRLDTENPSPDSQSELPRLFLLVTDSAFTLEDDVVWESLDDVDGSNSTFYDSKFRKSSLIGGDFIGGSQRYNNQNPLSPNGGGQEDNDELLARQLQSEEEARMRNRQQRSRDGNRRSNGASVNGNGHVDSRSSNSGLGRRLTSLGGGRRNGRSGPSDRYNQALAENPNGNQAVPNGLDGERELAMRNARDEMNVGNANGGGKKKWWKIF